MVNNIATDYPSLAEAVIREYGGNDASIEKAVRENLLRIELFYDRIAKTEVVQSPAVTDIQFISDIGKYLRCRRLIET